MAKRAVSGKARTQRSRLREGPTPAEARLLRKAPIYASAPPETIDRVAQVSLVEFHRRSEVLYYQGDASERCYVVLAGRVRVSRVAPDGRELAVGHALSGDVFGEWGLFGHAVHRDMAEVAEDTRVVVTPLSALVPLADVDIKFQKALARHAAARRLEAEGRLEAFLYRSVRSRLAEFLIEATKRDGETTAQGVMIQSRFTHLEIACTVGATRETVTLTLSDMRRRGILFIQRRRIIVRDATKLKALV
jgi:CRP-like cAMP-binding protein